MADQLDPALQRLLREYLERDEDDRRRGRTREHHEEMLQTAIDKVSALDTRVESLRGDMNTQLASHRVRLENIEAAQEKNEKRIDKLEEKLDDFRTDTGNYRIDELQQKNKATSKWWFAIGGALIAAALTIAADLIVHGLTGGKPAPAHVEPAEK